MVVTDGNHVNIKVGAHGERENGGVLGESRKKRRNLRSRMNIDNYFECRGSECREIGRWMRGRLLRDRGRDTGGDAETSRGEGRRAEWTSCNR